MNHKSCSGYTLFRMQIAVAIAFAILGTSSYTWAGVVANWDFENNSGAGPYNPEPPTPSMTQAPTLTVQGNTGSFGYDVGGGLGNPNNGLFMTAVGGTLVDASAGFILQLKPNSMLTGWSVQVRLSKRTARKCIVKHGMVLQSQWRRIQLAPGREPQYRWELAFLWRHQFQWFGGRER